MNEKRPPSGSSRSENKGGKTKRLGLRLSLLTALVLLAVLIWNRNLSLVYRSFEVGDGPAGSALPAAPFEDAWSERKVLLVGMGDSVTAGYGASPGCSYFDRLLAHPPGDDPALKGCNLAQAFKNLEALNISVSGSTSFDHLDRQLPRLKKQAADVMGIVVLTTGGNDLIHDYGRSAPREDAMYGATWRQAEPWIGAFKARLERLLAGIEERFPGGCHIFLANIYDPTDGVGDIENAGLGLSAWPDALKILDAYNAVIAACAQAHPSTLLVDMRGAMLGHGIHFADKDNPHYDPQDPTYWYFTNLEDPNDRGYEAIQRAFMRSMIDVFSKKP